ncbi:MAG: phage tail tape measure protein [Paracoccaceae bacterium]|nr:phage tail tape measure protein [Paracoccaceae bacterium]
MTGGVTGDAGALADQVAALEATLGSSASMVAAFDGELTRMQAGLAVTGREVGALSTSIGFGLKRAFDGLVFDGATLSDTLQSLARSMTNAVYASAMRPVQNALGGALAGGIEAAVGAALPFAEGAAFSAGRVVPFATGGVVTGPTPFAMRGATGLMGEAGPEAIMPLTRGPDGRLGVQTHGGAAAPVSVVMNITTPDVQGFQRSQGQIAAQLGRVLAQGQRNQ